MSVADRFARPHHSCVSCWRWRRSLHSPWPHWTHLVTVHRWSHRQYSSTTWEQNIPPDRLSPSTAGSASVDGLLCVWDLLTGACMYSIQVRLSLSLSLSFCMFSVQARLSRSEEYSVTGPQWGSSVTCLLPELRRLSWWGRSALCLGENAGIYNYSSNVIRIIFNWPLNANIFTISQDSRWKGSPPPIPFNCQGHLINSINTLDLGESECPDLVRFHFEKLLHKMKHNFLTDHPRINVKDINLWHISLSMSHLGYAHS